MIQSKFYDNCYRKLAWCKMSNPEIAQQQMDLLVLGFEPGSVDGVMNDGTQKAIEQYANTNGLNLNDPAFFSILHREAESRRALLPVLSIVNGNISNRKPESRDFTKKQYVQIHQTDYWPTTAVGMKTNLYVSKIDAFEVHPIEACIIDNYSDFYHIEVAWVSDSRKTVVQNGKTYHREAGVWTDERESLLETALVFAVQSFRERGVNPTLITHCQSYKSRVIDPDIEIAQASYRIAARQNFKLDFDWIRGSGTSAAKWYPSGQGKIG